VRNVGYKFVRPSGEQSRAERAEVEDVIDAQL
jgi:hypothetical protein